MQHRRKAKQKIPHFTSEQEAAGIMQAKLLSNLSRNRNEVHKTNKSSPRYQRREKSTVRLFFRQVVSISLNRFITLSLLFVIIVFSKLESFST